MTKATHQRVSSVSTVFTLLLICSYSITFSQSKERGFNLGLVYPLSVQGISAIEYTNVFSVQGFMGISKAERGFTAAGFGNIIRAGASGFQAAGFFNTIGGASEGFKAAGFFNLYHDANGFQAAGFGNFANGNVKGMQAAGFINLAHRFTGFQVAGYINKAEDVKGTQAAGFINMANDVDGTQIAGFINIAKKVKGAQVAGFINIADSSEYPIGLVNIIANGEKFMGATSDDNLTTMFTFRSGSRKLYGIIGAGYNFRNEKDVLAIQYGLGAHLVNYHNFRLNAEGTVTHLENFRKGEFVKTSLTVLPAIKIGRRFEVFAGPSLNYVTTNSPDGHKLVDHYIWNHHKQNSNREYGMYIGYTAGVHFAL
jgi:hypothetical protein